MELFAQFTVFALAVFDYWGILVGGAAMTLIAVLWEKRLKREIHWRWYRWILAGCLAVAVFLAWRDQFQASANARGERDEARNQVSQLQQRVNALEIDLHGGQAKALGRGPLPDYELCTRDTAGTGFYQAKDWQETQCRKLTLPWDEMEGIAAHAELTALTLVRGRWVQLRIFNETDGVVVGETPQSTTADYDKGGLQARIELPPTNRPTTYRLEIRTDPRSEGGTGYGRVGLTRIRR